MTSAKSFVLGLLTGIVLIGLPVLVNRWINPRTSLVATRAVRLVDRRTGAEVMLPPGVEVIKVKNKSGEGATDYPFDGLVRFSLDTGDTALQPVGGELSASALPVLKHELPSQPAAP